MYIEKNLLTYYFAMKICLILIIILSLLNDRNYVLLRKNKSILLETNRSRIEPNTNIYKPSLKSRFGTHFCTRRPCDCYIANCFVYCAWKWCFLLEESSVYRDEWIYFPCSTEFDTESCEEFWWPCHSYC
ncbi:hypothetical protein NH340_JMT04237 [Sarcoptes scabiei]|nr:hypothetical protein NH340_JMT04237 [Sarcoptes scabiei]